MPAVEWPRPALAKMPNKSFNFMRIDISGETGAKRNSDRDEIDGILESTKFNQSTDEHQESTNERLHIQPK